MNRKETLTQLAIWTNLEDTVLRSAHHNTTDINSTYTTDLESLNSQSQKAKQHLPGTVPMGRKQEVFHGYRVPFGEMRNQW